MSELTLQLLLGFDAAVWHEAADRWQRLARGIDAATDQLIQGTRDLAFAWPSGAGSAAAAQEATAVRTEVSNTYAPAKRIQEAIDQHAYAMSSLRRQAESIVDAARQAGYTVDTAAVTITAPASAYMGGNLDRTGRETGALLNDLRTVVEYARAQDDATAGAINANVPSAQAGFGASPPGAIARAQELINKIKDPAYQPTAAELDELRDLIQAYGRDQVFAFDLLNALGPKGLLELSGTLATYQLDQPGKDADSFLFSNDTADMVRDLQNGLGVLLATATTETGATTGLRGEIYVPGQYELSSQWVTDLMTAGRSRIDIGDPSSPMRYVEDVYGYQLLGPLLHSGGYDAGFLSTVGGDIVDFEIEQDRGSDLWGEARGENVRLDWTQDHDDNRTPAGYDPMNGLMDALSRNGEAGRELLTGVTEYTGDGPAGGRLPRLDYLLTDRNWEPAADTPGGPGWTAELMENGGDYRNGALDKFGLALERATTDNPGPDGRRLVESIIYETNVDEQALGAANGANPRDGKTVGFADSDLVHPEIRGSMANIVSSYISDVNQNMVEGTRFDTDAAVEVDRTHLVRFLADLGKDAGAHQTIAMAEAAYATGSYHEILSGGQDPGAGIDDKILRSMGVVSHTYGGVMGAVDFGAGEQLHTDSEQQDSAHNSVIEERYKAASFLADQVIGKVTERIPVPGVGDLANEFVGGVLDEIQESAKTDGQGRVAYDLGDLLGSGGDGSAKLAEMALYESGRLEGLPTHLHQDGQLKPVEEWTELDQRDWQDYKGGNGRDTVGHAASQAGESYQNGYEWARNILGQSEGGESK
ncbi:hypothetical protein [Actinoplanes philippinensis]|uniref:hypothetical protein n=1 Tax=Actinoplanes philippinensis TaxID=35752 RepID=UPI0034052256